MTILQAVILGIVQGIAEFLPISSSGHLVLFQKVLGVSEVTIFFDIILHIGTLIPVLIVYRKDIIEILKKPNQKMTYLLIVGTIPAVIVGLLFSDNIEQLFETGKYIGFGFLFTGFVLMYADKTSQSKKKKEKDITYKDALLVGSMQGLAILPAVSRSGSTIAGALFAGINKETAAKYSFLLSIPAIGGALVLQVLKMVMSSNYEIGVSNSVLMFGFASSMLSGYLAINIMLYVIKNYSLKIFSYYVFVIGTLVLMDQMFIQRFFVF